MIVGKKVLKVMFGGKQEQKEYLWYDSIYVKFKIMQKLNNILLKHICIGSNTKENQEKDKYQIQVTPGSKEGGAPRWLHGYWWYSIS